MRVNYRWSSGLVIAAVIASLAIDSHFGLERARDPKAAGWDVCSMWEQLPAVVRLAGSVCFLGLPIVFVQGLRNRAAPVWLAIVALVGFAITVDHWLWRVQTCYSTAGETGFWIECGVVVLMCLHHIIQRPVTRR